MLHLKSETRYTLYIAAWAITAVMGVAGVSTYYASNPGVVGAITAVLLFAGFMLVMKSASAILFDSSISGFLRFLSLLCVIAVVAIDVFAFSHEKQSGVMARVESAKAVETGTSSKNGQIAELQRQLAACPANHYTKCKQPLLDAIKTAQNSTETVAFNATNAGEMAYWVDLASWYNEGKLPENQVDAGKIALYVFAAMGLVGSLFAIFAFGIYGASVNRAEVLRPTPLPPTGTDGDRNQRSSDYSNHGAGFGAPVTARNNTPAPRASHDSGISYRATTPSSSFAYSDQTLDRPAPTTTQPRAQAQNTTATARAAQRWGTVGNAALAENLDTLTVSTQLEQSEQPETVQKAGKADRNSRFYEQYANAVATGEVRPTLHPTVKFLRSVGAPGSNEALRDTFKAYHQRMEAEGIIYRVDGRSDRDPKGQYEPTGKGV